MTDQYQWIPFYQELADKLLAFENKRKDLFVVIKELANQNEHLKYFQFEKNGKLR